MIQLLLARGVLGSIPNILILAQVPVRWRNTRKPSRRDPQVCTISGQKQIRFPGDSQEMQNYQECIERATKDTTKDDLQGSLENTSKPHQ